MQELILHVDRTLKDLLPAHTPEELRQLEQNIVSDGQVRDVILFWHDGERNIIADGMTRYEIATRRGVQYRTEPLIGPKTIEELELWVLDNQLGRRNLLTPEAIRKLRGEKYNRLKGSRGGDRKSSGATACNRSNRQNVGLMSGVESPKNAAERVASETGVTARTVERDGRYVANLHKLTDTVRKAIETGTIKPSDDDVAALAKLPHDKQVAVVREVRTGTAKTIGESLVKLGYKRPKPSPSAPAVGSCKRSTRPAVRAPEDLSGVSPAVVERVLALKSKRDELHKLQTYEDNRQAEIVALVDGTTITTVAAAIAKYESEPEQVDTITPAPAKPERTPEQEARGAAVKCLNGMIATIDTLRGPKGIDKLVAECGGRPTPDYAQEALDALDTARIALARWAKVA